VLPDHADRDVHHPYRHVLYKVTPDCSFDPSNQNCKAMKPFTTDLVPASATPVYDLVEACKKGDQKAQLQIYKLYYKVMYNICFYVINDPAKAEEVMQESFLVAFEEIHSCPDNGCFVPWLQGIIEKKLFS